MKDLKHGRLMLEMAAADLQAIRNMPDPRRFTDSIFGFHCQQAVEKLLKAWLSISGVACPRTHDLRLLIQLVDDIAPQEALPFHDLEDLTD
jgi:HEPN domain-containing protein